MLNKYNPEQMDLLLDLYRTYLLAIREVVVNEEITVSHDCVLSSSLFQSACVAGNLLGTVIMQKATATTKIFGLEEFIKFLKDSLSDEEIFYTELNSLIEAIEEEEGEEEEA